MAYIIIKEVDRLGRVVLPKNLRQHIGIKNGDKIELSMEEDKICMQKHDKMQKIGDFAEKLCDSLFETMGYATLITEKDKVIYASGISRAIVGKDYLIQGNVLSYEDKSIAFVDVKSFVIDSLGQEVGKIVILSKSEKIIETALSLLKVLARYIGKLIDG